MLRATLAGFVIVFAAFALVFSLAVATASPATPVASFAVKIDMPDKHGSGVHIGGGYILTAAHVAEGGGAIKVVTDLGASKDAEVLWLNKDYDIALLRIADYADVDVAHLSCTTPLLGATFTAYGNPGSLEFVSSAGRVVSKPKPLGPWKSVIAVDGTLVMGMSGGPVIMSGKVVGISVGVQSVSLGFYSTITGFGFVVPGTAICGLMAM